MLNILFMGTPDFAMESLKAIYEAKFNIVGVVTNPDKPQGRGMKVSYTPVKKYALEKNIPIYQPEHIKNNPEMLKTIKKINKRKAKTMRKHAGFTLAEVLITLGIIGVVSALTMPSLINEIQDRQFIAKWKKAYSIISNAVYSALEEYEFCKGTFIEYSGTTNLCSEEQIIETYRQLL